MRILLMGALAMLVLLNGGLNIPAGRISSYSEASRIFAVIDAQNAPSNSSSASRSPQADAVKIGSPTRVWRYVIGGSAVIILAVFGALAVLRMKRQRAIEAPDIESSR